MNSFLENLMREADLIHELPSVEVAVDHLDWAIQLLVDHKALIPAYSLAAIAEEQIGKRVQGSALEQMKEEYGKEDFNALRNFFKHGTMNGKVADIVMVRDMKQEVALMILRACENLRLFDGSACSQTPRFAEWMRREYPELLAVVK
ncbi:hypothetical protein NFI95_04790 [Acetobacteraceae bacterium KSS8]|uniref:Uncharacterized protein n=1 Tax=Endosaccharibacter trunci TaxID=2812733 RepID=A0ABT1W4G6_9PROT|nr:hypothetical protein [Acetobacteraceae bacterium KSS8]